MNEISNWFSRAIKIILPIGFFLVAGANIFSEAFIVPNFKKIFDDALPGVILPTLTQFVIAYRPCLLAVAVIILALGIFAFRRRLDKECAVLLFVITVQIGITVIALFLPFGL